MCNMVDLVHVFSRKNNLQVLYFHFSFILDFCTKDQMYLSSKGRAKRLEGKHAVHRTL